ncbi:MAG: hypothetical protein A3J63_01340 [Candidatus Moranbacteria bacterium RIFCSPHIGHO2_02_FULL_40_12b]|nr:MAG: hypothetical protein A3J63_01340 [Candidatus Moranbacteria bacterium RIFCSPHIGHO2_02_FULL_40_12b]
MMEKKVYEILISTGKHIIEIYDNREKIITEMEKSIVELEKIKNAGQEHEEHIKLLKDRLLEFKNLQNALYNQEMLVHDKMLELNNDISFEKGYWEAIKS